MLTKLCKQKINSVVIVVDEIAVLAHLWLTSSLQKKREFLSSIRLFVQSKTDAKRRGREKA